MNILILSSSSRHFPLDIQATLKAAGLDALRLDSLNEFIASPLRKEPFLAVLEVGSTEDIERALIAYEWAETVQPLATARYLLLVGSKHISLQEKSSRFRGVEIAQLPLPAKNLMFKVELQLKVLSSEAGTKVARKTNGFSSEMREVNRERVMVIRGPGPTLGGWKNAGEAPQGRTRWRWIESSLAKEMQEEKFSWSAESKTAPIFNPEIDAWELKDPEADLQCHREGKEIFSAKKAGDQGLGQAAPKEGSSAPSFKKDPSPNPLASKTEAPAPPTTISPVARKEGAFNNPEPSKAPMPSGLSSGGGRPAGELPRHGTEALGKADSKKEAASSTAPAPLPSQEAERKISPGEREEKAPTNPVNLALAALKKGRSPGAKEDPSHWRKNLTADPAPSQQNNLTQGSAAKEAPRETQQGSGEKETPAAWREMGDSSPSSNPSRDPVMDPSQDPSLNPAAKNKLHESSTASSTSPASSSANAPQRPAALDGEGSQEKDPKSPRESARPATEKQSALAAQNKNAPARAEEPKRASDTATSSKPGGTQSPEKALAGSVENNLEEKMPPRSAHEDTSGASPSSRPTENTGFPKERGEITGKIVISANTEQPEPNLLVSAGQERAASDKSVISSPTGMEEESQPLKTRHFLTLSLEELRDRNSTWIPAEGYRIYLSAHHRYYGLRELADVFPLWIYEGELSPEFLDRQKAWKFYDRLPNSYHSMEALPAPVARYLLEMAQAKGQENEDKKESQIPAPAVNIESSPLEAKYLQSGGARENAPDKAHPKLFSAAWFAEILQRLVGR